SLTYAPPRESVRHTNHFLESLSLETTDLSTIGPRMVRLVHALDHLVALHGELAQIPAGNSDGQRPPALAAGTRALAHWLQATVDPAADMNPAVLQALGRSSHELRAERDSGRASLLEDIALQRIPANSARAQLDMLVWADRTLYHAWRLAESLQIASGNPPT